MGQILNCCPQEKDVTGTVDEAIFDIKIKTQGVEVSKDRRTVSGTGCAVASTALHQGKCYYEFTLAKLPANSNASFCIGVSHRSPKVVAKATLGDLENSWAFNSLQSTETFVEGDVIGCIFDQVSGRPQVSLQRNGKPFPPGTEVKGFKGLVYPAVSVAGGCAIECNFSIEDKGFKHTPPAGLLGLIPSRSLV